MIGCFRDRRRAVLRRVSAVSHVDGRGERRGVRCGADRRRSCRSPTASPNSLRGGVDVADFGCGSGHAVNVMAQAFPGQPLHRDRLLRRRALGRRRSRGATAGVEQRDLRSQRRGRTSTATDAYDVITAFDAIHDQAQPARVLRNIHRALRPGGTFLMVDIKASSRLEDNVGVPFAPLSVHGLDHALHERVAGAGRRRAGHVLGSRTGHLDAGGRRLLPTWRSARSNPIRSISITSRESETADEH